MPAAVLARHSLALWLAGGSLACLLSLSHLSATLVDGAFVPADHDSFYHARRIIDSLGAPLAMYQFDARIHAPEGSWITWPWAYDTAMALAARALMALSGAADPMSVLVFVAPAWTYVNAALLLGVAARLGLSLPARILALLFFATSPLTWHLHRIGMLDHHYVEHTFVLATLYFGMAWFAHPASRRRAVALGAVLGAAPAFHNGLFVLQLPVLATLACLWAMQRPPDGKATLAFAITLVATTAAVLVPSEPFRDWAFSYYLHSWFHLYVAGCSAALCLLASRYRATARSGALIGTTAVVMALPVLGQIALGSSFVFGTLEYLAELDEFASVAGELGKGAFWGLTLRYSALLWLLPFGISWLLWRLRREGNAADIFFAAMVLFGSFLLLQQYRLAYFGSFALILPLCRLLDDLPRKASAAFGAAMAAAMLPGLLVLRYAQPPGSDFQYMVMRQMYVVLQSACARQPGIVLAEAGDGHYIRYHSECSVIANNFILTPQHVDKVRETEELLRGSLAEVLKRAPYVRYILIRRADNALDDVRGCGLGCPENRGLRMELLAEGVPVPAGLRLLGQSYIQSGGVNQPLARLLEVTP